MTYNIYCMIQCADIATIDYYDADGDFNACEVPIVRCW